MKNDITSNQMCMLVFKKYINTVLTTTHLNLIKYVKILFIIKGPVQSALILNN